MLLNGSDLEKEVIKHFSQKPDSDVQAFWQGSMYMADKQISFVMKSDISKNSLDTVEIEDLDHKMDMIFIEANDVKKYFDHWNYRLTIPNVIENLGHKKTKIFVFTCNSCGDCDAFVRENWGGLVTEWLSQYDFKRYTSKAIELIERYAKDFH